MATKIAGGYSGVTLQIIILPTKGKQTRELLITDYTESLMSLSGIM
jgi:hypothetical protein